MLSPGPCIASAGGARMGASAALRALTDVYGGTNTGSDAECTPASRPSRKAHPDNRSASLLLTSAMRSGNGSACAGKGTARQCSLKHPTEPDPKLPAAKVGVLNDELRVVSGESSMRSSLGYPA
jgi:hypothetical protein